EALPILVDTPDVAQQVEAALLQPPQHVHQLFPRHDDARLVAELARRQAISGKRLHQRRDRLRMNHAPTLLDPGVTAKWATPPGLVWAAAAPARRTPCPKAFLPAESFPAGR